MIGLHHLGTNECCAAITVDTNGRSENYSQSTSCVTSISANEMNIQISLCNVRHVNEMLNISLEIFPKKPLTEKKDSKYLEKIVVLEILSLML